jgi:hypothetical protein
MSNRKEHIKMRNLKILGLALVAMFAMSALGASMASADELTAEEPKVTLHAASESADSFIITAGNTNCKEVTYDIGTVTTPTTTVTANPTYPTFAKDGSHNCTSIGFPATIDTNGCHYLFHVTAGASTVGDVTVQCPAGKEITVTAIAAGTTKCTIHVPPQTLSSAGIPDPVTYTNIGAGTTREVTIAVKYGPTAGVGGLKYTHVKGTGVGACASGAGTTGTFEGKGTVTANDDANTTHKGLFLSAA